MAGLQLPSTEILQSLILQTLDRSTSIANTRNLVLIDDTATGDAAKEGITVGASAEEQLVLKSALDSLSVREVRLFFLFPHSLIIYPSSLCAGAGDGNGLAIPTSPLLTNRREKTN